jgi:hypothetical protein
MRAICNLALLGVLALPGCGEDPPPGDGAAPLGTRQLQGYRIDVAATLSLSQAGFGVTTTGGGKYRLMWRGAQTDLLEGKLTTDGQFDPTGTSPLGGKELVANQADLIEFHLNPTAQENGIDVVTSGGPVYLDLTRNADRTAVNLRFVREGREQLSAHNPVAIQDR